MQYYFDDDPAHEIKKDMGILYIKIKSRKFTTLNQLAEVA